MEKTERRIIPVTQWNDHHAWPPQGGLRHLIFHAATNGFDKVDLPHIAVPVCVLVTGLISMF